MNAPESSVDLIALFVWIGAAALPKSQVMVNTS